MALAVPICNSMPVHGPDLVFFLMYVWSREYPTQNVNIMGVVSLEVGLSHRKPAPHFHKQATIKKMDPKLQPCKEADASTSCSPTNMLSPLSPFLKSNVVGQPIHCPWQTYHAGWTKQAFSSHAKLTRCRKAQQEAIVVLDHRLRCCKEA